MNSTEALHRAGLEAACAYRFEQARTLLLNAAYLCPEKTPYRDLAIVCSALRRWGEAASAFSRVRLGSGESASVHTLKARAYLESGRTAEALSAIRVALAVRSNSAAAHGTAADICQRLRRYSSALKHARSAVRVAGNASPEAHARLAVALWDVGDLEESLRYFRLTLAAAPDSPEVRSAYVMALLHSQHSTAETVLAETRKWSKQHGPSVVPRRRWSNSPEPDRVLRIGYLGGEFAGVPNRSFLAPILASHDHRHFTVCCYHSRPACDSGTKELRNMADLWRDVSRLPDGRLLKLIRRDRIDVLVDVSGHHSYNRLAVFAQRAAPVQMSFPGCPATTGLSAFDCLLTDAWTSPPGSESEYSEPLFRLPAYLAWTPPTCAPAVTNLPALENGFVTFGLFQRAAKLTPELWDVVGGILTALPTARILVHHSDADLHNRRSAAAQRVLAELARRQISADRVRLQGYVSLPEHLRSLASVDIALDTFPYNGQTTTCECLWMGLPVITVAGTSHAARVGSGLVTRAGLTACVARDPDEYVGRAVRLASYPRQLSRIRRQLRSAVIRCGLTSGTGVAQSLESAYRHFWKQWCSTRMSS